MSILEERLVAEGICTKEEIEQAKAKHCAMLDQTVPFGNGVRVKVLNRTPNHAVGEVYKPQTLRVHDPDGLYAWEERVPVWVWVMRALGALGFMVGIYCLVFLGMLL